MVGRPACEFGGSVLRNVVNNNDLLIEVELVARSEEFDNRCSLVEAGDDCSGRAATRRAIRRLPTGLMCRRVYFELAVSARLRYQRTCPTVRSIEPKS